MSKSVKDSVVICLNSQATDQPGTADWIRFDSEGNKTAHQTKAPLEGLCEMFSESERPELTVLVPGEDVLYTRITVPKKQQKHLERTLPFLVEEFIAEPIEAMHLVAGQAQGDNVPVAVVSHQRIKQWLGILADNGLQPDQLIPDSLAVPDGADRLTLLLDKSRTLLRLNGEYASKIENENLGLMLDACLNKAAEQNNEARQIQLLVTEQAGESPSQLAATQSQLALVDLPVAEEQVSSSLEYLAANLKHDLNGSIDLLAGPYRVKHKVASQRKEWRRFALVASVCIVAKLVLDLGAHLYFDYQSRQVDSQIVSLYRSLFPNDRKIINPKVQMENHLKGVGNSEINTGFLRLAGILAEQLKAMKQLSSMQLQRMDYDSSRGTFMLELEVKQIKQLDELKQRLTQQGVQVDIQSASEEADWVRGRLRISG